MISTPAIFGGRPALRRPLAPFNEIGRAERRMVDEVMRGGVLSGFVGAPGPGFDGGPMVRRLEDAWCARFGCRHAVTVNSATSGLFAAMGAIGLAPGDEVIVPPFTMSATAMAPLVYGGIPVFADIDPDTFCLDVGAVERALSARTRAVLAVNLFGQPAPLAALRRLADRRGLRLIEDNAQGPLSSEGGRPAGTIGDIGVFSLNRHKHIQTGEGGVCVTDDDDLALRLRMIRNHGENLVEEFGIADITNLLGYNYRLTELSAAVGVAQFDRAEEIVARRIAVAKRLSGIVGDLDGIGAPVVREGCRHVYYVWAFKLDSDVVGASRAAFVKAMAAEGVPLGEGYVRPLYRLPVFERRRAFGGGWPFALTERRYGPGLCPVAERMHERELAMFEICSYRLSDGEVEAVGRALRKVHRAARKGLLSDGRR